METIFWITVTTNSEPKQSIPKRTSFELLTDSQSSDSDVYCGICFPTFIVRHVYFDIQQLMYSKMNKFVASSSAMLLLLAVSITVASAAYTRRGVQMPQDNAEQLAALPEKVKTLFRHWKVTTGNWITRIIGLISKCHKMVQLVKHQPVRCSLKSLITWK